MSNFKEKADFIWEIADSVLRGTYKRNEYQHVILPFTVLKRFDSVLEHSKDAVVKRHEELKASGIQNPDPILKQTAVDENGRPLGFYNHSRYDFKKLLEDPDNIEENLLHYLDSFSDNQGHIRQLRHKEAYQEAIEGQPALPNHKEVLRFEGGFPSQ